MKQCYCGKPWGNHEHKPDHQPREHILTPPQRRLLVRIGKGFLRKGDIEVRQRASLESLIFHGYVDRYAADLYAATDKGLEELGAFAGLDSSAD